MNVTMIQTADAPEEMQPGSRVDVDDDGDIWITFSEGDWRVEFKVAMSPALFLEFVAKAEDIRNQIELAHAAKKYAEARNA